MTRSRSERLVMIGLACLMPWLSGCGGADTAEPSAGATSTEVVSSPDTEAAGTPPADPATLLPEVAPAARALFAKLFDDTASLEDREAAQQELRELGREAVPVLITGLQAEEATQREVAASELAMLGPDAATASEALIRALADKSVYVRANAAATLLQLEGHGHHVVPVLAEFLESDDVNLRRMAAVNLVAFDRQAEPLLPKLISALDDEDPEVVEHVVRVLGQVGPPAKSALPRLRELSACEVEAVAVAADVAILQIEVPEAAAGPDDASVN